MDIIKTVDHPWSGIMVSTTLLSQNGEIMFERNIALIASRKQEVQIFSDSFVYEGFICGLDQNWVQIYGHEESNRNSVDAQWRFILILKSKISGISPTGRYVNDLVGETRQWVDKKIKIFADVCERFLVERGSKNDVSRERDY